MSGRSLGASAYRGGLWLLVLRVGTQLVYVIELVVLARVLDPKDFGLLGVALLVLSIVATFTETGFESALIHKKGDVGAYLDAAWTVLVMRGVAITALMAAVAPLSVAFFDAPQALYVVPALGLTVLIDALTNIGVVFFRKELQYDKYVLLEGSAVVVSGVVSVVAALLLRNVWALVVGKIAGRLARTALSYVVHSHRPRFDFGLARVKELLSYGKWVLSSGVLALLLTEGDDILVGRLLGTASLGLYQMAYRVSCLPATEVTGLLSNVAFPAYAKIQDDQPRLRRAHGRVLTVTAAVAFAFAGSVSVLARESVLLFLGAKWLPMTASLIVLCWYGVARSLTASMSPVFMAIGRPRDVASQQAVQAVIMYAFIFPAVLNLGITGASLTVLGSALIAFAGRVRMLSEAIGWRARDYVLHLLPPAGGTVAASACAFGIGSVDGGLPLFVRWAGGLAGFLAVYCLVLWLLDRVLGTGAMTTLRSLLPKRSLGEAA